MSGNSQEIIPVVNWKEDGSVMAARVCRKGVHQCYQAKKSWEDVISIGSPKYSRVHLGKPLLRIYHEIQ